MLLISGQTVRDQDVQFAQDSQGYWRFSINGQDITDDIRRVDKERLIPNFDIVKENIRLSEERGAQAGLGSEPLNESTGEIFVEQVLTDPFSAPLQSLNNQLETLFALPGFKKALAVGAVIAVVYLAYKFKD